jgi:sugar (pentulose or hexulose) kinase
MGKQRPHALVGEARGAECVAGIDVGSQSIRAIAFLVDGSQVASAARPTPVIIRGKGEPSTG